MIHFVKYNIIGLLNTGITLLIVWILHQVLDISVVLANFLGYVAGGLNSYFWNKHWNFKSQATHREEAVKFLIVFAASYFLNLGVLLGMEYLLATWEPLHDFAQGIAPYVKSGYIAHVVANIVYVLVSFYLYKKIVFRSVVKN